MKLQIPPNSTPEPPIFRSAFGGLWTDRRDAHQILAGRMAEGRYSDAEAERLAHYIDHGYVIFPRAVDPVVIDEYLELFERAWDELPSRVAAISGGVTQPLNRDLYDQVAKVSGLHMYFDRSEELIFPPVVLEFLTDIYERPPVAFQTMSMRKGSEERLHIDTGPLTLTEPMTLCASWVALEDVQADSGEFEYVPGTHRVPETLHQGVAKGHDGDQDEYYRVLECIHKYSEEGGLKTERFMAKKGDVLIWHGDLMHGGAKIVDPSLTRKSFVAHFMPLGVMANFYDFSDVGVLTYPNGGYCLDQLVPKHRRVSRSQTPPTPSAQSTRASADDRSYLGRLKVHVPQPMRTFVGQQLSWLAHNPELSRRKRSKAAK